MYPIPFTTIQQRYPYIDRCWQAFFLIAIFLLLGSACTHHRGPWDINEYIGALERPERDEYQRPEEVLGALHLRPGMVVADIGAGSGYFTRRFAHAVHPNGKVLAVDVEQKMLDYNRIHLNDLGPSAPTEFILAKPGDPAIPAQTVDLIFLCNVYHHLDNQPTYFEKAKAGLKPNGRVAIIDFYHDERSGKLGFSKHHLVPEERVIKELKRAGFTLLKKHEFLPRQYFLEFTQSNHPT